MDLLSDDKQQDKNNLSSLIIDYNKNNLSNSNINKAKQEFFLNSCNDYSEFKQNYLNTVLKNISINFGFPNTINTYKYKNSFPLTEVPLFEQHNIFYYDKDFQLFKNKSVSKYGEKKNINNTSLSKNIKNNRILSPQHKIITSIKKKKYLNEKEVENIKKLKNETDKEEQKDIYELEVINQILLDEDDLDGKKNGVKKLENEWGEIEQEIFENEKDKKNNLLNSIQVEIEKENGDKQLKVVEISKEEKDKKEPCIKIKYTVEDKICLNSNETPREDSNYDKETKDSALKSMNYKTNTNTNSTININYSNSSIKKHDSSILKKENVSELLLKENKSTQNIYSPSDNEKIYYSGSIPSNEKYKKYSNYKQDFNLLKEKKRIEPMKYNFGKEEEISPIKKVNEIEEKNIKLMDIINDGKEEEIKPNKSIEIEERYFNKKEMNEKNEKEDNDDYKYKKKNFFEENKENIIDRNRIIKEKRIQESEIEKNKKNKKERYKSFDKEDEEMIKKEIIKVERREEIKEGIRDKYRKKKEEIEIKRDYSNKEKRDANKNDMNNQIRYRQKTFQNNKKNLEEKEEKIIEINKFVVNQRYKDNMIYEKEERIEKEKERLEKERQMKERLEK